MAYPDVTRLHIKTTIKKGSLQSFANLSSVEGGLLVLDHESMQSEALSIYLNCYKNKLCELELSSDCNIEYATMKIVSIYLNLSNPLVGASDESHRGTWRSTWSCKELPTVIKFFKLHLLISTYPQLHELRGHASLNCQVKKITMHAQCRANCPIL